MTNSAVDNPFFARLWSRMSTREPESIRRLRRENLAGRSGRVLEVGAGTGTNFAFYPATVTEVVAVEPERRLAVIARRTAEAASVPVTVSTDTVEKYQAGEPFDAVVCSLVLCSVDEPDDVLRQLFSMLRPGGELRYLEHVARVGARGRPAAGRGAGGVPARARAARGPTPERRPRGLAGGGEHPARRRLRRGD